MALTKKHNKKPKRKIEKTLKKGRIYILATFNNTIINITATSTETDAIRLDDSFNNTIINITDMQGNSVCWGSSGAAGFRGSRKSTPYAAMSAISSVLKKARAMGLNEAEVFIKGPGTGREAALKMLRTSGLRVPLIADVTPIAHNGCRAKKRRRG